MSHSVCFGKGEFIEFESDRLPNAQHALDFKNRESEHIRCLLEVASNLENIAQFGHFGMLYLSSGVV